MKVMAVMAVDSRARPDAYITPITCITTVPSRLPWR
jgi:hypothetical protein